MCRLIISLYLFLNLQITVGLFDTFYKPIRGSRVRVKVQTNATAEEIVRGATTKMACFDKAFNKDSKYILFYQDGSLVEQLPESGGMFTLEAYKKEVLLDYAKILLFIKSAGMN